VQGRQQLVKGLIQQGKPLTQCCYIAWLQLRQVQHCHLLQLLH
jgi:hypothetical protein